MINNDKKGIVLISGSEFTKILLKEVCEKDIKQLFFVFCCFYLDFLNFSSIDFCLEAEGGNKKGDVQEMSCQGERMGRESIRTDYGSKRFQVV